MATMPDDPAAATARVNRAMVEALLGQDDPRVLARMLGEVAGALAVASKLEPAEILAIVHTVAWGVVDHLTKERAPA